MAEIEYSTDGGIAYVRLHRPDKHNGLTLGMLSGLVAAARRAGRDPSIRAVIIHGDGPSFCSGLDFGDVARQGVRVGKAFFPNPIRGTNRFQAAAWAWRRVPVPVIAVIHGRCFGGGLQIALGADFRFATTDAEFSVLETKYGLIPDMSATASLAQLTSIDTAKLLTMTGEVFDAERARSLGLLTGVADDPMVAARDLAATIATRSPDAVASAKRLFERTWSRGPRRSFGVERLAQLRLLTGRNSTIARKAAATGTQPDFRPRA